MSKESKKAFFIITIILSIAMLTIIFYFSKNLNIKSNSKTLLLKIPDIKTVIHSNDTKKNCMMKISLYIDVVPSKSKYINISDIHSNIENLLSSLELNKISSKENISYIKKIILEDLSNYLPKDSVKNIYINNIYTHTYNKK